MNVKQVMTPDPACCTPQTALHDVAKLMLNNDCGEIPVIDDRETRRPIAVITDRDITIRAVARALNPADLTAADCMTQPCVSVTPEMSLVECCDVMERAQVRRVPVVDENGRLCGIVALADVAKSAGNRTTAEVVKVISEPSERPTLS